MIESRGKYLKNVHNKKLIQLMENFVESEIIFGDCTSNLLCFDN